MRLLRRALVVRCLGPGRAIFASSKYITDSLAPEFTEFPAVSRDAIASEARNSSPVIFLLPARSDPTPLMEEAAMSLPVT
jgi:hypothetical protein